MINKSVFSPGWKAKVVIVTTTAFILMGLRTEIICPILEPASALMSAISMNARISSIF